jgi:hypothetical protein
MQNYNEKTVIVNYFMLWSEELKGHDLLQNISILMLCTWFENQNFICYSKAFKWSEHVDQCSNLETSVSYDTEVL